MDKSSALSLFFFFCSFSSSSSFVSLFFYPSWYFLFFLLFHCFPSGRNIRDTIYTDDIIDAEIGCCYSCVTFIFFFFSRQDFYKTKSYFLINPWPAVYRPALLMNRFFLFFCMFVFLYLSHSFLGLEEKWCDVLTHTNSNEPLIAHNHCVITHLPAGKENKWIGATIFKKTKTKKKKTIIGRFSNHRVSIYFILLHKFKKQKKTRE